MRVWQTQTAVKDGVICGVNCKWDDWDRVVIVGLGV